jgi:hypothetical protein
VLVVTDHEIYLPFQRVFLVTAESGWCNLTFLTLMTNTTNEHCRLPLLSPTTTSQIK